MALPIKNRPIIVLGHAGMLGQMAVKYFDKQGYTIITLSTRFEPGTHQEFMNEIRNYPDAIVINAIGKIKQKTDEDSELLWANAILPLELQNHLLPSQTLIHPSTDCVFSGKKGKPYSINDEPDATDSYGWSKRLGEIALMDRPNTLILRVSIIGPDNSPSPKGLLSWFLAQPEGSKLNGYTNHFWNGITTLEWCRKAEKLMQTQPDGFRILQLGTEKKYSKYEMLKLFGEFFKTNYAILPIEQTEAIDRRLTAMIISHDLDFQLKELIAFH